MKILLIEDSPTLQFQLARQIDMLGHSVITAKNGEVAVQLMELSRADLVVCDVEMPGLNGYETVSIIREFLGDYWVPIIFITGNSSVEDFVRGFKAGADDYLTKPVQKEILQAKIEVMEKFVLMQKHLYEVKNTPNNFSLFDKLTQFYCEESFAKLAVKQWAVLSRQRLAASVLVLNIDQYSYYLDYYGEAKTEQCIEKVADAIRESVKRPGDFIARFGSDDFAIMLPDTGRSGADKVAERIRMAVENLAIEHKKSTILGVVSVSVGGGTALRVREQSFDTTIELARQALDSLKRESGNGVNVRKIEKMTCHNVESKHSSKTVFLG